jgi:tRNA/rRNA methyltransferase
MTSMHDETAFVLVQPSHAGNVGAAARALKVMGFSRLLIVRPRLPDVLRHADAIAFAGGAADVLAAAELHETFEEALAATRATHICATAMTPRDFGPPVAAPRALLPPLVQAGQRVAFVFGTERTGLANEDVYRCASCLSIPTALPYGSLNLAQAVQIVAYEWRQALGGFEVLARTAPEHWADAGAVSGLLEHWRQTLVRIGFLDPAAPKKLMPRLTQLAHRARLTEEEVHILRGIARAAAAAAPSAPLPPADQRREQG